MKLRAKATVAIAAVLVAATALSALRGQDRPTRPAQGQPPDEHPLPVVDFSDKAKHEKDAKRRAKGKRYDNLGVVDDGAGLDGVGLSNDWAFKVTGLPTKESDVIVVGTVLDAQAYLSPEGNGIYSEFNVKVEEVLKDLTTAISAGNSVAVDREGGRVRYPSGEVVPYFIHGQGMPKVNKRYVLFLKREEEGFSIITGYELQGGKVRSLDYPRQFRKFEDASEDSLLKQIRSAISTPSGPPEMG